MTYDGLDERGLAALLRLPVVLQRSVSSVLDVAHDLGTAGAPAGTLVLADEQTAGRGRQGREWYSPPGAGIWMAMLLRPAACFISSSREEKKLHVSFLTSWLMILTMSG